MQAQPPSSPIHESSRLTTSKLLPKVPITGELHLDRLVFELADGGAKGC